MRLRSCTPGLITVLKYGVQNLYVDVISRKLLTYFSFYQAFKFFFCFAFAGMANIEENEIFVSMNHNVNLQCIIVIIWWIYYHLVVVSVLLWIILLCRSVQRYLIWVLRFFSPLNSRNHNIKFLTRSYLLCLASSFYQYYQSMYTWSKKWGENFKNEPVKVWVWKMFENNVLNNIKSPAPPTGAFF